MYNCSECSERIDNDWYPMDAEGRCPDCHFDGEDRRLERADEIHKLHGEWLKSQENGSNMKDKLMEWVVLPLVGAALVTMIFYLAIGECV